MKPEHHASLFTKLAKWTSHAAGQPVTFAIALLVLLLWAVSGPLFGFSDTWQLVINTGTTIITFLMVFLIQNTQNRDSTAVHLKLDELIRVTKDAQDSLMDLEELEESELEGMHRDYEKLAQTARAELDRRSRETEASGD